MRDRSLPLGAGAVPAIGDGRSVGHERVGHERVGHERVGHERVGHERVGHERVGPPGRCAACGRCRLPGVGPARSVGR
ncbi:hypothetical protein, partial [Streptomyces huiliensis]|uniref:hypothetical protein n=1 Tax=Streptomyces huiliensis TaxID=2876027 RepID=UPI001CBFBE15